MGKNLLYRLILIFYILFFAFITPVSGITAYQTNTDIEIETEIRMPDLSRQHPSIFSHIQIKPIEKASDTFNLVFWDTEYNKFIGQLKFFPDHTVLWEGKGATAQQFQKQDLLLVFGLTIPVDILPVNYFLSNEEPLLYNFKREIAHQSFINHYQISAYPVNFEVAQQANWIRIPHKNNSLSSSLKMIEVKNVQTGQLVVKQLWAPLWSGADNWWLYEQTPFRQSWRIK